MPLSAGTRLGPYEVTVQIGVGGMGEVYRARDTRLDRLVALKVLPTQVAGDPDLRSRFEREARAVAALDHPHICGIYDVGGVDGTHFLVMPHLDGQTLAARLEKGPLPLDQALKIAVAIADALAAAHRHGITHRDLKPANIMLTTTGAKLLDFGLAKLCGPVASISLPGMTRLETAPPATAAGTILGTVQYMAPEQVEGREADARSDIWAFGAVLFEMVTGHRPFGGDSPASVIGAILKDAAPRVSARQPVAPPALDHVVERCLAKDPAERWHSIGDVKHQLEWIASDAGPAATLDSGRHRRRYVGWAVASLVAILLVASSLALLGLRSEPAQIDSEPVVFSVSPPAGGAFSNPLATVPAPQFAMSPDGRQLVFVAAGADGIPRLWVRPLAAADARPLAGTEGAAYPFWSPNSRSIGFFAQRVLKTVDTNGAAPQVLTEATSNMRGGTWNTSGDILFIPDTQLGLMRVPASGGNAVPIKLAGGVGSAAFPRWPLFLPDGRTFLVQMRDQPREGGNVYIGSLDDPQVTHVAASDWSAQYSQGFLLYLSGTTLMAQPLSLEGHAARDDAVPLRTDVAGTSTGYGAFSVSTTGVLAYANTMRAQSEMRWFDRAGRPLDIVAPPANYADLRLSPDEMRLAYSRVDPMTQAADVWILDLRGGSLRRVTTDSLTQASVLWSPGGDQLVYRSNRGSPNVQIKRVPAAGVGQEDVVLTDAMQQAARHSNAIPTDWSADGSYVVYQATTVSTGFDLWALPMKGTREPLLLAQTPFNELHGVISPDARWMAYESDESGRYEVYVQAFPVAKERWTISSGGGSQPRWSRDGRELLYLGSDGTLVAVPTETNPSFVKGAPVPLFKTRLGTTVNAYRRSYVPTADGQRFLMSVPVDEEDRPSITVIVNWPTLLKR